MEVVWIAGRTWTSIIYDQSVVYHSEYRTVIRTSTQHYLSTVHYRGDVDKQSQTYAFMTVSPILILIYTLYQTLYEYY